MNVCHPDLFIKNIFPFIPLGFSNKTKAKYQKQPGKL
jgi:hypothetical protein